VEIKRAARYNNLTSVVLLDIDFFKHINDKHGHSTGDLVLVAFSKVLKKTFRGTDVVARFGGEEFIGLLPQTGNKDAGRAAEKVLYEVAELEIGPLPKGAVTFSAGVATYPSAYVTDATSLVERADQALYRAKEAGRKRVVADADS
jgi:diguanylate cyclase (GGDEF)-like protein